MLHLECKFRYWGCFVEIIHIWTAGLQRTNVPCLKNCRGGK